jgi:hypothetical protein
MLARKVRISRGPYEFAARDRATMVTENTMLAIVIMAVSSVERRVVASSPVPAVSHQ